jgi:hypothetical protein
LKIDLIKTELEQKRFAEFTKELSERDWIVARKSGKVFEAFGGPCNLGEMIEIFLTWAT